MILPDYFHLSSLDIGSETNNISSDSKNLKRNTRDGTAQRWAFSLEAFILKEDFLKAMAFLNQQGVNSTPVEVNIPEVTSVSLGGQKALSVTLSPGQNLATLVNFTGVEVGDFFKFSNHTKVYQVIEKVGTRQIRFYPKLLTQITAGVQTVDFANCPITAYITTKLPSFSKNALKSNATLTLDFVEKV